MRAAMELGTKIPKLCATDIAGRLRLLPPLPRRDRGPQGHARLLHHAGGARHQGPDPDGSPGQAAQGRDGTLYLRPSARLPHLRRQRRLRIAGHGRRRGPARGALRLRGRQSRLRQASWRRRELPLQGQGRVQSLFHLRSGQVHRLLALRARLRGSAGHLRADHRRPRLRLACLRRHGRGLPQFRMRVLRRLRAGLPDGHAHRRNPSSSSASRSTRWSPPAPIAASAAPSRPR